MTPKTPIVVPATVLAAAASTYVSIVRPHLLRWGATSAEVKRPLPGDGLLPRARYVSTRAVTIAATPEEIWPWLVGTGQRRGRLYSHAWVENHFRCQIHSADRILRELRQFVAILQPNRILVLSTASRRPDLVSGLPVATWAFVLDPQRAGGTRLIVRWRCQVPSTLGGRLLNQYLLEPVDFVIERKMLLGVKERAERQARSAAGQNRTAA